MAASKILTCGIRNQKSLDLPLYAFEKKKKYYFFFKIPIETGLF
jgi:hypothetical protein